VFEPQAGGRLKDASGMIRIYSFSARPYKLY